jgi:hypothetical protein
MNSGERIRQAVGLRLDDAFRQFLAERGAKVVPVQTVANLFTGTNRIRLAALTLASLPAIAAGPGPAEIESVAVAGAVLRDSFASSRRWYQEFAELLADRRAAMDSAPVHDAMLRHVLQVAFDDSRARHNNDCLRVTLRMLWAAELLQTQSPVQSDLARSAELFTRQRHQRLAI